jgi:hypothetical protein
MNGDGTIFKYNYTFLYRSVAVYAMTLAAYILIRGFFIEKEFSVILHDPVMYLLSAIIIISVVAIIYNIALKRRIVVEENRILLRSSLREIAIERADVRSIRRGVVRTRGPIKLPVVSFRLKSRRRPLRVRTYNFERSEKLYDELKIWAGKLLDERKRMRRNGGSAG